MFDKLYVEMLNKMYEGVYYVDFDRKIEFWNNAAEEISGFKSDDVVSQKCYNSILKHVDSDGNDLCLTGCPLHATLSDGEVREADVYLQHKDGHRIPVSVKVFPIYDNEKIVGAVEIFISTENSENEYFNSIGELKDIYTDKLTGFANKELGSIMLDECSSNFKKTKIPYSTALITLDNIGDYSETYGSEHSDKITQIIGKSIVGNIRSEDIIIRWKNDEFLLILKGVNEYYLENFVNKIKALIDKSGVRNGVEYSKLAVSIGAAVVHPSDNVESLLERTREIVDWNRSKAANHISI